MAFLTSLAITLGLAFKRNLGGFRDMADRGMVEFAVKNLLASVLAGLAVWTLRAWVRPSETTVGNFLYLCELCGAGSVVFFGMLAATRALPISGLAAFSRRSGDL